MNDKDATRAALTDDIERVSAGDRDALQRVYRRSAAKLFGICTHFTGDSALAEDALQEVYLKVWQHAASFDPARASPITWLSILARNTAIDLARGGRRHSKALEEFRAAYSPSDAWATGAEFADKKQILAVCFEALALRDRAMISDAFMEGFTHSELAARAEVPLGTMKGWIRRALAQLRDCLANG